MTKRKNPEDFLKMGAPTKYNAEMASRICELIATHDLGYSKLKEKYPDLPDRTNVNLWRRRHPEFRIMYAQAKREQIEFLTEEIMEIADDGRNDWMQMEDKKSACLGWQINSEHVQRSRLRIDTRKWLAAKLVPRVYGDAKEADQINDIHKEVMKRKHELDEKNKKDF